MPSGRDAFFTATSRPTLRPLNMPLANTPFGGGGGFRDMADPGFEGYPIQQTIFRNGQPEVKMETKSIARASFSDADFSLGNAKKVEMPIPQGKR